MEGGKAVIYVVSLQLLVANGLQTDGDRAMPRGHLIATPRRKSITDLRDTSLKCENFHSQKVILNYQ